MIPLLFDLLTTVAIAVVIIIIIIVLALILIFNGLISKRNRVQDAWAQIDVQLKRRYDLIPNLLETVKGYMKYEKNVLTQVTQLRSSIITGSIQDKARANDALTGALKSIFAVAENYPDLKASQTFQNLQSELENTEDKISFVRTSYNDYVLDYNNAVQQFPGNVLAGAMGFKQQDYFKVPDEEAAAVQKPVQVNFDDSGGSQSAPSSPQTPKSRPKAQKK